MGFGMLMMLQKKNPASFPKGLSMTSVLISCKRTKVLYPGCNSTGAAYLKNKNKVILVRFLSILMEWQSSMRSSSLGGEVTMVSSWWCHIGSISEVFIVLSSLWEVGVDIMEAALKGTEVDSIAGVSSNSIGGDGGTPIAGDGLQGKASWTWMMIWGYSHVWKPPDTGHFQEMVSVGRFSLSRKKWAKWTFIRIVSQEWSQTLGFNDSLNKSMWSTWYIFWHILMW